MFNILSKGDPALSMTQNCRFYCRLGMKIYLMYLHQRYICTSDAIQWVLNIFSRRDDENFGQYNFICCRQNEGTL